MAVPVLHRVHIQGFRAVQHPLELDLCAPNGQASKMAVLAGPNGSGKTSVLEAILLALGQDPLIVRDLPKEERDDTWRVRVPEGARIEVGVSIDGGEPETWVRTEREHFVETVAGQRRPLPEPTPGGRFAVEYFSSWRAPKLVGPIKPLVSGRRPGDVEANRLWKLKQRVADERSRQAYQAMIPGMPSADTWLRRLNEVWRQFHPKDKTFIDVQIVDAAAEDLYADLYVLQGDQRLCTIDQLSAGEIELLSFAGWMILNDFASGLLLIDEPELHLHPQWQAAILPALRTLAPEAQIIVASHADAPWDQAFSFERFLLSPHFDPATLVEDEPA